MSVILCYCPYFLHTHRVRHRISKTTIYIVTSDTLSLLSETIGKFDNKCWGSITCRWKFSKNF